MAELSETLDKEAAGEGGSPLASHAGAQSGHGLGMKCLFASSLCLPCVSLPRAAVRVPQCPCCRSALLRAHRRFLIVIGMGGCRDIYAVKYRVGIGTLASLQIVHAIGVVLSDVAAA